MAAVEPARMLLILEDPGKVKLSGLVIMIKEKWAKLRPHVPPLQIKKLVADEFPTVDLDPDLTVADVWVDKGKARGDGHDQQCAVRVIQQPAAHAPARFPSVEPDWEAYSRTHKNRKKKESIQKITPIPEEGPRSSIADHRASLERIEGHQQLENGHESADQSVFEGSIMPSKGNENFDSCTLTDDGAQPPPQEATEVESDSDRPLVSTTQGKKPKGQPLAAVCIPCRKPAEERYERLDSQKLADPQLSSRPPKHPPGPGVNAIAKDNYTRVNCRTRRSRTPIDPRKTSMYKGSPSQYDSSDDYVPSGVSTSPTLESDNDQRSRDRKRKQTKDRDGDISMQDDATAPVISQDANQVSNAVLGKRKIERNRRNTDHARYLNQNFIIDQKMRSHRSRNKKEGFVDSMSIRDPDSDSGAESDGNATSPRAKKAKTVNSLPDESETDSDPEFQPTVSRRRRRPSSSQPASSPQRRSVSFADEQGLTLPSDVEPNYSSRRSKDRPSSTPTASRPDKNPNPKPYSSLGQEPRGLAQLTPANKSPSSKPSSSRTQEQSTSQETEESLAQQERIIQGMKRIIQADQAKNSRPNANRTVWWKQAAVDSNNPSPGPAIVKPRNQGASADESSATRKDTQKEGAVSPNKPSSQATMVKPRSQGSISQQGNGQTVVTIRDKSGATSKPVSKTPTANSSRTGTVQSQAPTNNNISGNASSSQVPMSRHSYSAMTTSNSKNRATLNDLKRSRKEELAALDARKQAQSRNFATARKSNHPATLGNLSDSEDDLNNDSDLDGNSNRDSTSDSNGTNDADGSRDGSNEGDHQTSPINLLECIDDEADNDSWYY